MIKTIPIFLPGDRVAYITAGPTKELPDDHMLIRCAAEIPVAPDRVAFDISTGDFMPFDEDRLIETVPDIIEWLGDETRKPLYAGCMGGTGRTGTILAILVAQHPGMTSDNAIKYIRQIYKPHAVETREQAEQVCRLTYVTPVPELPELDLTGLAAVWGEPGGPEQPMEPRKGWLDRIREWFLPG